MIKYLINLTLGWDPKMLLVACILFGIALGVVFHLATAPLSKKLMPQRYFRERHEIAGHFIGVVGVIYAVLVAFVVVTAWQAHRRAEEVTVAEQRAIENLFELAGAYAAPPSAAMRVTLLKYVNVAASEWQDMRDDRPMCGYYANTDPRCKDSTVGLAARRGDDLALCVNYLALSQQPHPGSRELVMYQMGVGLARTLREDREEIQARYAERTVQPIIWLSFLLGALILAGMTYCVPGQNWRGQLFRTASFFGMIGMMVALGLVFDHPFIGKMNVDGGEWQSLSTEFQSGVREDARLNAPPVPCNGTGRPPRSRT